MQGGGFRLPDQIVTTPTGKPPLNQACAILTKRLCRTELTRELPPGYKKGASSTRQDLAGGVCQGRSDVFARAAVIKVKPGCKVELPRTLEQEVILQFRKEKDFRGLFAITFPNGTKALSLSLWDQKESAGGICARGFGALAALARAALGTLPVQVFEVSNSPLHTLGQMADQWGVDEATPDLKIYQSAFQPFRVSPARHTRDRGFPQVVGSHKFTS
jgi:hypothetical protein